MNEVAIPTCGRIVHYFNHADADAVLIQAEVISATVLQTNGLNCNLSVLTQTETRPILIRLSVPHKSQVDPADIKTSYWDWPVRE